jgi:hypothetical protein
MIRDFFTREEVEAVRRDFETVFRREAMADEAMVSGATAMSAASVPAGRPALSPFPWTVHWP